ncbi:CDP-diacylglycerol--serine O-phosphatidyltransferase [Alkalithermobacter paradoxus]|uniref:CDP-diacylglycerol--serine O-phosphatidyltransferase n=1 Tax=Alkalithermobacter paradoxus TaxID=29349 RepID=A0A1V4I796_9FIRM|nr:CDP-diacylglycerol--glycerol-3-phosphate 3-phosphatidyltransferase [[Clostridium] thermoalcaliphilum]
MKIRENIPNMLTLTNMALGINAILISINGDSINSLMIASLLIILAAIFDRYDGKLARFLNVESELGKQLDSLSDLISFGVAPIIVTWKLNLFNIGLIGYMVAIVFVLCGAFRLARYNILDIKDKCIGLPITIAGVILALNSLFQCAVFEMCNEMYLLFTVILSLLLSILMVMKFEIRKV